MSQFVCYPKIPGSASLGQQTMAASSPVAIASDQSAVAVSLASAPLPTGASTAANQTAVIGSATGGSAAVSSLLEGGVYNTALPSLTNGQQAAHQLDSSARLILSPLTNSSIVKAQLQDNAGTAVVLGQTTMSASLPVAFASNQSSLSVSAAQSGTWNITNISGTVSLPTGASTETTLSGMSGKLPAALGQTTMAASMSVAIASNQSAVPVSQSGTWTVQPGNTANTTAWLVKQQRSATATLSNVASSASSVSLLASNASRLGATFFNDSTATLYLKYGTTASTTSYTVQLTPGSYYELPGDYVYTGAIDGIWSAANGAARITELT